MNKISVIGLDLAKDVFQVHGIDEDGAVVLRKQLMRAQVLQFFARLEPCLVGIEACGGSHYWSRVLGDLGHTVRMMAAAFVKPYLKSNKNDRNDAEAICEAVQRPSMRFVSPKAPHQQAVLHLHHGRDLLTRQRVAIGNHIRGVLQEYGFTIAQGTKPLNHRVPELLEDGDNELPYLARRLISLLKDQHDQLIEQSKALEKELQEWHRNSDVSQRLEAIPGVGVITATALAAMAGNASDFRNGRQLSAYLGLVPRQSSSGGKECLLGISKRGDGYLRKLLIHGARSVIRHVRARIKAGEPSINPWIEQLLQRCHPTKPLWRWPTNLHELHGYCCPEKKSIGRLLRYNGIAEVM